MLKSFDFMAKDVDLTFYYKVSKQISSLRWYFYKFAGVNADEAMQKTFLHTIVHFNSERGDLPAYVKKLAREITKDNGKLVLVDFLQDTLTIDGVEEECKPSVDVGSIQDFSDTLVEEYDRNESKFTDIGNIALEYMDKFVLLCEELISHDTSTKYFPEPFKNACLRISSRCDNFNGLCLSLYDRYGEEMKAFLELGTTVKGWKESDFLQVSTSVSKRIKLVNTETGLEVEDADLEDFVVHGRLGTGVAKKKVIRVYYEEVWEHMCEMLDATETNEVKFIIGDSYIVRTFGGSLSILNPDLYNEYDVVRMEILTNILLDTGGRLLNIGSKNAYLVCNSNMDKSCLERDVLGYRIYLPYTDITSEISTQ